MARFAQVIKSQIVNVLVVKDEVCLDERGIINEEVGRAFLKACNLDGEFYLTQAGSVGWTFDPESQSVIAPPGAIDETL